MIHMPGHNHTSAMSCDAAEGLGFKVEGSKTTTDQQRLGLRIAGLGCYLNNGNSH